MDVYVMLVIRPFWDRLSWHHVYGDRCTAIGEGKRRWVHANIMYLKLQGLDPICQEN